MAAFYYDTTSKLVEIFTEHCNLSGEQYEVISGEFIYLVCDIQDDEPQEEIEKRIAKMRIIFDFLLETKELWLEEHGKLNELLDEIQDSAEKLECEPAQKEGVVL